MEKENLVIFCDGGSRGNPGPAASAFVAVVGGKVIYKESKYLGTETNNVAEYSAVLLAVTWFSQSLYAKRYHKVASSAYSLLTINLDSQLVERQLNNKYKIKNINLIIIYDKIKLLINKNNLQIKFLWNFREKNKIADSLVNEELDRAQRENKPLFYKNKISTYGK